MKLKDAFVLAANSTLSDFNEGDRLLCVCHGTPQRVGLLYVLGGLVEDDNDYVYSSFEGTPHDKGKSHKETLLAGVEYLFMPLEWLDDFYKEAAFQCKLTGDWEPLATEISIIYDRWVGELRHGH